MHDQAKLTDGTGAVAATGSYVTIDKVESVYSTSAAANAVEAFECANPACRTKVIAVITQPTKLGRRTSPSSYFRASPKPHVAGCDRQPTGAVPSTGNFSVTKSASPFKAAVPTIWVAPPVVATGTETIVGAGSPTELSSTSHGGRVSSQGTGTGRRRSMLIELFARAWQTMSPSDRANTLLQAPWNLGGSYATAFLDLTREVARGASPSPVRIYKGTVASIHRGTTGYSLTLAERHDDGHEFVVWIQNATASSGPSGGTLWARLQDGAIAVGAEVFALGQFHWTSRPTRAWHALPIVDGHDIWIP